MNKHALRFTNFICWLARFVFPTKVHGDKNIEIKRTVMVGNHLSAIDAVTVRANVKKHLYFMYKAELEKIWIFRVVAKGIDIIPVHRGEADMYATKQCLRVLKNDQVLVLFPEGKRNVDVDTIQEFKTGSALFAIRSKAPVIPFYIWDRAMPFRRNHILFGTEFELSEFYDKPITKQLLIEATAKLAEKVEELRVQLNAELASKGIKRRRRTKKEKRAVEQLYATQQIQAQQCTQDEQ